MRKVTVLSDFLKRSKSGLVYFKTFGNHLTFTVLYFRVVIGVSLMKERGILE